MNKKELNNNFGKNSEYKNTDSYKINGISKTKKGTDPIHKLRNEVLQLKKILATLILIGQDSINVNATDKSLVFIDGKVELFHIPRSVLSEEINKLIDNNLEMLEKINENEKEKNK